MQNQTNQITQGPVAKALIRFAIPYLISSLLQALYGAVDLFVVGQYADSSAVSAVAIGSQVMQTITGIILGISMGGTVLIGHCIGAGDHKKAADSVGTMAILFLIIALVLTPLMLICTNGAVSLMQTPAESVQNTRSYIFICATGIPFIIGYNAVSGIFRGLGDSKTPTWFVGLACIINIAADFILVGGFHMGAAGAALATILAQAVSFITALFYMYKKGFAFSFGKSNLRLNSGCAKSILKVGFPLALQDGLVNISFLSITAIINTMGLIASAAVGVVEKIIIFAMLPPSAFGSAVATMTAQNIGAGKPKRAFSALKYGIGFSLIFGIAVCTYVQFQPETLTRIFTTDPQVITAAGQYLRSYAIDCILVSFIFCMNAYLSGCDKSVVSFIHSMIATFGVRIPATALLSHISSQTLYPMGLAAPAASTLSILICAAYFLYKKRRPK